MSRADIYRAAFALQDDINELKCIINEKDEAILKLKKRIEEKYGSGWASIECDRIANLIPERK